MCVCLRLKEKQSEGESACTTASSGQMAVNLFLYVWGIRERLTDQKNRAAFQQLYLTRQTQKTSEKL